MRVCPDCVKPEPSEWCWENKITCPLSKSPRSLDVNFEALRVAIWLLAELTWKFDHHRHDGGGPYGTAWGPVLPHWK